MATDWLQQVPPHLVGAILALLAQPFPPITAYPTPLADPPLDPSLVNSNPDSNIPNELHQSTADPTEAQICGRKLTSSVAASIAKPKHNNFQQKGLGGEISKCKGKLLQLETEQEDEYEELPKIDEEFEPLPGVPSATTVSSIDPEQVRLKKIHDLIIPTVNTAVYKRLGYKHHTDPEYRKIRIAAEAALMQPPLPFFCNLRWSEIKKKATREVLIGKVEVAIGLNRDVCLGIILGLIETQSRRATRPINEKAKAEKLPVPRGRPKQHGRYANRVRKTRIATKGQQAGVPASTSSAGISLASVVKNTLSSSSFSPPLNLESPLSPVLATTPATSLSVSVTSEGETSPVSSSKRKRLGNNPSPNLKQDALQQKKNRLADLQNKAHATRAQAGSLISVTGSNDDNIRLSDTVLGSAVSDIHDKDLYDEYPVILDGKGMKLFYYSWTFQEFLAHIDVKYAEGAWYKFGSSSTNLIDCPDTYKSFLDKLRAQPQTFPKVWPRSDNDFISPNHSEDEDLYSVPVSEAKVQHLQTNSKLFQSNTAKPAASGTSFESNSNAARAQPKVPQASKSTSKKSKRNIQLPISSNSSLSVNHPFKMPLLVNKQPINNSQNLQQEYSPGLLEYGLTDSNLLPSSLLETFPGPNFSSLNDTSDSDPDTSDCEEMKVSNRNTQAESRDCSHTTEEPSDTDKINALRPHFSSPLNTTIKPKETMRALSLSPKIRTNDGPNGTRRVTRNSVRLAATQMAQSTMQSDLSENTQDMNEQNWNNSIPMYVDLKQCSSDDNSKSQKHQTDPPCVNESQVVHATDIEYVRILTMIDLSNKSLEILKTYKEYRLVAKVEEEDSVLVAPLAAVFLNVAVDVPKRYYSTTYLQREKAN
ncbi:hypothetical protein EDC01DRAFT_626129 [Geopyxis carbonaria]|nr:hypothetical protein EDC01DRAFT_626129 [Geopyxis carbonaria]